MLPIVDGLTDEFEGQAMVQQLDAAELENERLQQQYGLRGHPTFVVLDRNGRAVQTFIGPQTAEVLREAIMELIAPAN
jgi:thioredoxin-like negative regulator of GroEL